MKDVFSKEKRADIMRRVRPRGNRRTEVQLARLFRKAGISGWRRHYKTEGTPDFFFPHLQVAVFVDGCFWHGCPLHGTMPATRRRFWKKKLDRNRERDILIARTLRRRGVSVIRIWEHDLRAAVAAKSVRRIVRVLRHRANKKHNLPSGACPKMKTVDLFCGCGGMSLGFTRAGFDVVAAFDSWKEAIDVYSANFDHPAHVCDMHDDDSLKAVKAYRPDVIVGGPPCQDFSSAGPNRPASKRAGLLERFVDVIESVRPKFFVMENVPRSRLRPVFTRAAKRLHTLGYGLTLRVLDASLCGVPQTRERLFLVGGMGAADDFLGPRLDGGLARKPLTLREYFGDSLGTDYYFRVPTNYSRRGVFSIDEPSTTIRGVDRPIPKGYPGHPDDPAPIGPKVRAFTVLERSYIQTFPRNFVFNGTKSNLNTMIGNAVPVKLAEYVAKALKQYIEVEQDAAA